ncbi:MAG: Wzz/FepE/Etk N-terminal domain-containing protein [Oscillospiraceae bacterium]|nr:Wzz/FepE/Etk N-terminal domain-containing protein [Oscillospiraceae bacterium]MDD4414971.1 Wzz/FepE/Etk N-terminal domain-containing protein [Oscillospiraceae bacterium]
MRESLDLMDVLGILLKRIWLIILISFIGFLVAFGYTKILVTPMYTSSIKLYVSNNVTEENQDRINYSDISASQLLVNTYRVIIRSDKVLDEVIRSQNLKYTANQLRSSIRIESVEDSQVMEILVTTPNPKASAAIANAIANTAPGKIKEITETGYIGVIDNAFPSLKPSSPNLFFNCFVGILIGGAIAAFYIIIREMLDDHIKGEEDLKRFYDIPMLGSIPVLNSQAKGGYYQYER